MENKRKVVLGLGNLLQKDEGFGVRVRGVHLEFQGLRALGVVDVTVPVIPQVLDGLFDFNDLALGRQYAKDPKPDHDPGAER